MACARAGMPVAAGARRADRLQSLIGEITAAGGRAIAVQMDVDRPEDCQRLIDQTLAAFGSVYSVFANAGFGLHKAIHETSDAEMRAIFETNFFGTLNTIRPALPQLMRARAGHILICSSCLAKAGTPWHGAYSATKAAQDHIARAMRIELKGSGIVVSSVHPVGTRTEFFERAESNSAGGSREVLPGPPSRFLQPPETVARAIVRALRKGRGGEIWTTMAGRLAFAAIDLFPRLGDAMLERGVKKLLDMERKRAKEQRGK
jgi:short-subunit dehydrogenase